MATMEKPAPDSSRRRRNWRRLAGPKQFALLGAVLALLLPLILQSDYLILVTDMGAVVGLIVLGLVVLAGYTGLVSLGQVAFYSIGAYVGAIVTTRLGWSPWVLLLIAPTVAAAFGVLVGIPAFNLRGPFLVIITIGFAEIIRILEINLEHLTGGPFGISRIPSLKLAGLDLARPLFFYYFIAVLLALAMYAAIRLRKSRVGRALIAIRDDELTAEVMGVNVKYYKIMSFAISAFLAGFAGALYAFLTSYIGPDLYTFNESALYLCMSVLGGFSAVVSPLVGVLLTLLPELLRSLKDYYMLFFSFILMVLVLFAAWREHKAASSDSDSDRDTNKEMGA
jgi:branched-chain amino acid transport system permease protein